MIAAQDSIVICETTSLSHQDAMQVAQRVLSVRKPGQVVLDLPAVREMTTGALAAMIILRRELLRQGRDSRLRDIRDRAAGLYDIRRLHNVLPRLDHDPIDDATDAAVPSSRRQAAPCPVELLNSGPPPCHTAVALADARSNPAHAPGQRRPS